MNASAKGVSAACALLVLAMSLPGCIVYVSEDWGSRHYPPVAATFYVYAYDYYSGAPIPWAAMELYEEGCWSWDYLGTWPMSPYGYAVVTGGYLEYEDCDSWDESEEWFRLVAFASGYYTESVELSVDYHNPSRTVRFYLAPWPLGKDRPGERAPELGPGEGPPDRVRIDEASEA